MLALPCQALAPRPQRSTPSGVLCSPQAAGVTLAAEATSPIGAATSTSPLPQRHPIISSPLCFYAMPATSGNWPVSAVGLPKANAGPGVHRQLGHGSISGAFVLAHAGREPYA